MLSYTELDAFVKRKLKPSRYIHTLGVVNTALSLASRFSLDKEKVGLVSLYHDAYKYDVDESTVEFLEKNGVCLYPEEHYYPELLHAPLAAFHFSFDVGRDVTEDMINAVRNHTLGSKDMGKLGAVLYIADYIEPNRKHLSDEDRKRILSHSGLEEMVLDIFSMQHVYFLSEGIQEAEVSISMAKYLKSGGLF